MGRKIFVSYKYSDNNVRPLSNKWVTTARHYVDELQELIEEEDHINKGENDGENLSSLEDSTIGSKLGDKIYDSSVTIVLISPNMKEHGVSGKDQWIPWEVSYSLREQTREGRISKSNAVIAVVFPDRMGSYDYFIGENTCPNCNCRTLKTETLFSILNKNMFNHKNPQVADCRQHLGGTPYKGLVSYIQSVKWDDFKLDITRHIDIVAGINSSINDYNITKSIQ